MPIDFSAHIAEIWVRDEGICHYCEKPVWVWGLHEPSGRKQQASKDHVVPRYYGGANAVENYVLACVGCNSKRCHELDWCSCEFCKPLLDELKSSSRYFKIQMREIIQFNKPSNTRSSINP